MNGTTVDNLRDSSLMMPSILDKTKSIMEGEDEADNL
jgi:hypothetical protein